MVFWVAVGLSAVAYALSRIEFGNDKRKSPISKQHKKFFNVH